MKLFHLSDLHLGKRVNGFSMLEDQQYILNQIVDIAARERPDAVLIAGDVYDKPVPPAQAVELLDDFLARLFSLGPQVLIVSGNHDSPERLAFGARIMDGAGICFAPVYRGQVQPVTLMDEYGPVHFFMLPFLKPAQVRACFPDESIEHTADAVRVAIGHMGVDSRARNVLITHQFVAGAARCDSEELFVGGTDAVGTDVFRDFDYTALGHIHSPQNIGSERVRYCGTPLKYSFSEVRHKKSITVAELGEKGRLAVRTLPLTPLRDWMELRGSYEALTQRDFHERQHTQCYARIILTDEQDIPDAIARLRMFYPNIMKLEYDNTRTREHAAVPQLDRARSQTPLELFGELYAAQNNQPLSPRQEQYLRERIGEIWEGEE